MNTQQNSQKPSIWYYLFLGFCGLIILCVLAYGFYKISSYITWFGALIVHTYTI